MHSVVVESGLGAEGVSVRRVRGGLRGGAVRVRVLDTIHVSANEEPATRSPMAGRDELDNVAQG